MNTLINYKQNKQVLFQIVANTGETLGMPIDGWYKAECFIQDIIKDKELCSDTDLSEITYLELVPTTNY